MQYFKKELPLNPIYDSSGSLIPFEAFDRAIGYLATDDDKLATELKKCISDHRGGILNSSQEEYEEFLKKKPVLKPSGTVFREEVGAGVAPDTMIARATASQVPTSSSPALSVEDGPEPEVDPSKVVSAPRVGRRTTAAKSEPGS